MCQTAPPRGIPWPRASTARARSGSSDPSSTAPAVSPAAPATPTPAPRCLTSRRALAPGAPTTTVTVVKPGPRAMTDPSDATTATLESAVAHPTWTTADSSVAVVASDGSVIARGPGFTTVTVVVGAPGANARLLVKQRGAGVGVAGAAGDTAGAVLEGSLLPLRARAVDARGHGMPLGGAVWHIDDTSVATLDSRGMLTARNPGRTVVSARIEDATGYLPIWVATTASALSLVAGTGQRALAGHALPQRVVVR